MEFFIHNFYPKQSVNKNDIDGIVNIKHLNIITPKKIKNAKYQTLLFQPHYIASFIVSYYKVCEK